MIVPWCLDAVMFYYVSKVPRSKHEGSITAELQFKLIFPWKLFYIA